MTYNPIVRQIIHFAYKLAPFHEATVQAMFNEVVAWSTALKTIYEAVQKAVHSRGILDSSNEVSQNVDSYKQKAPLLKMG
ncbi:hypothetical protein [Metasolibacillus fluoroglycofenilyticus]|uniref:hypothetical protein n=1 Tax=Metasolibacillus fluoroglycofenilyticus TaxID=1239396 RepID=UPI000D3BEF0B|nr:hypothetical protein [Metasolibacillus fluoroglycofenilyticus]